MMMDILKRTAAFLLSAALVLAFGSPVRAADSGSLHNDTSIRSDLDDGDVIDVSRAGSLTIHKYDITAAEAAREYTRGTYTANGEVNERLEAAMADFAISGVGFTYLRLGNVEQYRYTYGGDSEVHVVYEVPKDLSDILGLDPAKAYDMASPYVSVRCSRDDAYHFDSTCLQSGLTSFFNRDDVAGKSALESYLYDYGTLDSTTDGRLKPGAVRMPVTDGDGVTRAVGLELGLYLVVETEVPEQVTDTVDPWFVSLPFTNVSPDGVPLAGGDYWLYDMTCYPKNQTGNPTLDKSVRNAYNGSSVPFDKNVTVANGMEYAYDKARGDGTLVVFNPDLNAGNPADVNPISYVANRGGYTADGVTAGKDGAGYSEDFMYRDTTTASAGDVLDYILVSKLPHISSRATFLSEYTFRDILCQGLTYNDDVQIAFYDNARDAGANHTYNAVLQWDLRSDAGRRYADSVISQNVDGRNDGAWTYAWQNGSQQMTVSLTEEGLAALNGSGTNHSAASGNLDGLSDCYMVVYYTATVNSNDKLVLGDDGNENDVVLTWARTSDGYQNTLEDRNYVYAYGLDVRKEFSDGKGDMSRVAFKLYNRTDAYYVDGTYDREDKVYYVTGKTVDKDDATSFVPNGDGSLLVLGLEADEYALTEVSTDNGYVLLADQITVGIQSADREVNASVAGVTGMDADAVDAIVQYYHGGIYDENGELVLISDDKTTDAVADGSRPSVRTADGRTIGKTDTYVGQVVASKAWVDRQEIRMGEHAYQKGRMTGLVSANGHVGVHVTNHKGFRLPMTGGLGTLAFTLAGCVSAVAGVWIITGRTKVRRRGN